MRMSSVLSVYIGRNFLVGFLAVFVGFLMLILTFDIIELLRRTASDVDIAFPTVLKMAFLKLPHMGQQVFPFAVLFGGMAVFWRLTRSHELVVTRASGVSAWQFLLPVLLVAFGLGVFKVALFNPLASATLATYEAMEATLLKGQTSLLNLSTSGLWLRQAGAGGPTVVHADRVLQQNHNVELRTVSIYDFGPDDRFANRIDADRAVLQDGFWQLFDARIYQPEQPSRALDQYRVPTDLTLGKIQDSFAPPETLSFWHLPEFIRTLEESGFSALRHRLYWHSLMAGPLLMCAMVLLAATFTLRQSRQGGTLRVIALGLGAAFLLFFFSDLVFALGLSDRIPVALAAWTPSGVATLLGLATLLHLEDG
ncbi:MAG: LPS export ABC transporter permease LptG [Rhodobacterales bacterium]|nr:LPS export ABC transporter permease LptG [Rhodobacterales bacterium]